MKDSGILDLVDTKHLHVSAQSIICTGEPLLRFTSWGQYWPSYDRSDRDAEKSLTSGGFATPPPGLVRLIHPVYIITQTAALCANLAPFSSNKARLLLRAVTRLVSCVFTKIASHSGYFRGWIGVLTRQRGILS